MAFVSPIFASISADSAFSEVLQQVVAPGFFLVVAVLGLLALITKFIGVLFVSQTSEQNTEAVAGASSLSAKEYAVVAAAVHSVLRTADDPAKDAVAATAAQKSKQGKEVRIVSVEKK